MITEDLQFVIFGKKKLEKILKKLNNLTLLTLQNFFDCLNFVNDLHRKSKRKHSWIKISSKIRYTEYQSHSNNERKPITFTINVHEENCFVEFFEIHRCFGMKLKSRTHLSAKVKQTITYFCVSWPQYKCRGQEHKIFIEQEATLWILWLNNLEKVFQRI